MINHEHDVRVTELVRQWQASRGMMPLELMDAVGMICRDACETLHVPEIGEVVTTEVVCRLLSMRDVLRVGGNCPAYVWQMAKTSVVRELRRPGGPRMNK